MNSDDEFKAGFFLVTLMFTFMLGHYISTQYTKHSNEYILSALEVCKSQNSSLTYLYSDGDVECANNSYINSIYVNKSK